MSPVHVAIAGAALAGAGLSLVVAAAVEVTIQYRKARRWSR